MRVISSFRKITNKIREWLGHYPFFYAFIGGVGVVLFWRGIWHLADELQIGSFTSIIISIFLLLLSGLFVSVFIGHYIIFSKVKHEEKTEEKEESEIKTEIDLQLAQMNSLNEIKEELKKIENDVHKNIKDNG